MRSPLPDITAPKFSRFRVGTDDGEVTWLDPETLPVPNSIATARLQYDYRIAYALWIWRMRYRETQRISQDWRAVAIVCMIALAAIAAFFTCVSIGVSNGG